MNLLRPIICIYIQGFGNNITQKLLVYDRVIKTFKILYKKVCHINLFPLEVMLVSLKQTYRPHNFVSVSQVKVGTLIPSP